jgi:hypothetical protein
MDMSEQLALIEGVDSDFRLDTHTREIGLNGVAEARRILAEITQTVAEREAPLSDAA